MVPLRRGEQGRGLRHIVIVVFTIVCLLCPGALAQIGCDWVAADAERRQDLPPFNSVTPYTGTRKAPRISLSESIVTLAVGLDDADPKEWVTAAYVKDQNGNVIEATEYQSPKATTLTFHVPAGVYELTPFVFWNLHGLYRGESVTVPTNSVGHTGKYTRECGNICKDRHTWKQSLEDAQEACDQDPTCEGVADFSPNQGSFALCKQGSEYSRWHDDKACFERKVGPGLCTVPPTSESLADEVNRIQRVEFGREQPFTLQDAGSLADEHLPGVTLIGRRGEVKVGYETQHQQTASGDPSLVHWIGVIYVENQEGHKIHQTRLRPGGPPTTHFGVSEATTHVTAFAFCNRHGLFKGETLEVNLLQGEL